MDEKKNPGRDINTGDQQRQGGQRPDQNRQSERGVGNPPGKPGNQGGQQGGGQQGGGQQGGRQGGQGGNR
jgi:hypothetical protein